MKEIFNNYLGLINKAGVILILISSFFLFSNLTTEFYDTPKFLVLLATVGILLTVIAIKFALNNKVVFIRTPLDIPLLLLLVVGIVSTFASSSPYVALLGNQLRIHGSLASLAVLVIFYFVLVNGLRNKKEIDLVMFVSAISGAIVSLISLLAYFGLKLLPNPWTHGINFTTTGSNFTTTAILAILIPVVILKIVNTSSLKDRIIYSSFLTIFGVTIALTGVISTWITALIGLAISLVVSRKSQLINDLLNIRNLKHLKPESILPAVIPFVIIALVTILSLIPPIGGAKNPLYATAQAFPRETNIPFITSWKIAVSSFRDAPFWGSGPATYLFDFTNYKPIEVNASKIWNIRFDSAFNEYLQILATLGGVGIIALLSMTALFFSSASRVILSSMGSTTLTQYSLSESTSRSAPSNDKTALAISGILFFVLLALHPSTFVLWVFGLFILAVFYLVNTKDTINPSSWNLSGSIQQNISKIAGNITSSYTSAETIKIEALPSIFLTVVLALIIGAFFFAGKFTLADYHHRLALNATASNQIIPAYNEMVISEKFNPYNDTIRTDIAQINFALANAIASSKGPTESSPSGSLTDQDKQNIQTLLQQSINEAKKATELSPRSALNWEILALLYRQIAGVADNALTFSLDSYGKAIYQDPLNPNLRLSVGGVYYAVGSYDNAIRFFTDSINLKPDHANGYYNLSVALRDKGDLQNAQAIAEKLMTLVEKDSVDYKTAEAYLTDLKSRIAAGTTSQSDIKPPASETQGALQQKELPKVVNVGTPPEKIATPPAIKKPASTQRGEPNSTPEPTAQP